MERLDTLEEAFRALGADINQEEAYLALEEAAFQGPSPAVALEVDRVLALEDSQPQVGACHTDQEVAEWEEGIRSLVLVLSLWQECRALASCWVRWFHLLLESLPFRKYRISRSLVRASHLGLCGGGR